MEDGRKDIVVAAHWAVQTNKKKFKIWHYAEVRPIPFNFTFPKKTDCSGLFTWVYWVAGAHDPNKRSFDGQGYTGTLISCGKLITLKEVRPGDAVIYGPGTGDHVAIVIENDGKDPMTVSMGQEGDPAYVKVSQDGRAHRYFTYDTTRAWPKHELPPPTLEAMIPGLKA